MNGDVMLELSWFYSDVRNIDSHQVGYHMQPKAFDKISHQVFRYDDSSTRVLCIASTPNPGLALVNHIYSA